MIKITSLQFLSLQFVQALLSQTVNLAIRGSPQTRRRNSYGYVFFIFSFDFLNSYPCKIIDSDKIFVVDDGKIIASGTHSELLESCNFYKKLYSKDLV